MKHERIQAYYDERHAREDAFPRDDVRTAYFLAPLLASVPNGALALDFGCGVGYACELLYRAGYATVGIEIAESALERARERIPQGRFYLADPGGRIPLESGVVDALACLGVLEHIPEPHCVLAECRRVLADHGRAVFVVPNAWSPYFAVGSGTGQEYEKPRTRRDWVSLFRGAGFAVLSCRKDPGPTIEPTFATKKKLKIRAHQLLNWLPMAWTYQFVFELMTARSD